MRVPWLLLSALMACAGPAGVSGPDTVVVPSSATPVVRQLDAGTIVRLAPLTLSGTGDTEAAFVDGLWREALRQSPELDFAGGIEDTPAAAVTIELHLDQDAGQLASTLRGEAGPALPLASAAGNVPDAVDRLALATRQALGDSSATAALPSAMIYSAVPACVVKVEAAAAAAGRGELRVAEKLLLEARPRDPGCTPLLAALAAMLVDRGQLERGAQVAYEALLLESRLSPTTRHRLARTVLLSRAGGGQAERADLELLQLAEASARERPHDPHVLYSRALALNFLSRFTESAPLLRQLRRRWPDHAVVAYHSTFAELGTGQPQAARSAIEAAAPRLPRLVIVLPRALALYHCGEHDELRAYLAELTDDPAVRSTALLHEVRRMQAAHALLTDRPRDAVGHLLADLEWIRQRPSKLQTLALDVAEAGEVLVRIGHHDDLRLPLAAFDRLDAKPPLFDDVLVFLSGLIEVTVGHERATAAEASLERDGQQLWSSTLKAIAHRQRGELQDELRQWVLAYQSTESPLARASLARVLRAAGSEQNAAEVIAELRRTLLTFRLRPPYWHPLLSPASALAYLATL